MSYFLCQSRPFFRHTRWALLASALLVSNLGCTRRKTVLAWEQSFPVIGSQSSPRTADLNKDGVLDIVIGAGKNEYQESVRGILALDGKTGAVLWQQKSTDQVYGSATFLDITGDGVEDVFIGGRSPNFKALDGKTGDVLWEYRYSYETDPVLRYARFNFNNSVLVPDQNADGFPDLLTVNGGNSKAAPGSEENRFPGVLMLMSAKTGEILAADTMPDGKESYMSPLYFDRGNGEKLIVFGSGGETISGKLYVAALGDLLAGKLGNAREVASDVGHGFIASPVLADVSGDGTRDIIAISHGSAVFAVDGSSLSILWKNKIEGTESSNSFAVGYFTGDEIPDFFTFVSEGQWPDNTGSRQVLFDGGSGQVTYMNTLGCTGFSSPVVYDLNGDGIDEAILSINEFDCSEGFVNKKSNEIFNKLIAINFKTKDVVVIDQSHGYKNIFSTPWLGDLDEDGHLDIVHCQYYNPSSDLMVFLGMTVKRISTHLKMRQQPTWGAYMGSRGDGVF